MMSSSSLGKKYYNKVLITAAIFLVALIRAVLPASAQGIGCICNKVKFHRDDHRRVCAYHLLDNLLGWTDPVPEGDYYDTYDCDQGRHTVYGYRWRGDGNDTASCLGSAKDVLQNKQCAGSIGGRAWGEGCYMRFEIYPFDN